ncbi:MAG: anaerobic ribonucleoside-triphosphate reductase activating protein [Desulfobacterales bacterium S5133MH4]|nr:MAG: anaerobic ribonucleoside-triphosphate reductase activating protein [Desulfobacterales bacterium S5133MH4]
MTNDYPPIKDFIESSFLDWPGHTCAVIFLPYCNLRCPYCHNHQLVLKPDTMETLFLETILERLTALRHKIDGICITGGEPTIHRGLPAMLKIFHEAGFGIKLDTNGTQPDILQYLITEGLVDCVAMDVKAPLDDTIYARCAGVFVPMSIIKRSIEVLVAADVPTIFRCTVTPTLLAESDVYLLAKGLNDLRTEGLVGQDTAMSLTLQNFDPANPMEPALKDVKPFTEKNLSRMQEQINRILG